MFRPDALVIWRQDNSSSRLPASWDTVVALLEFSGGQGRTGRLGLEKRKLSSLKVVLLDPPGDR